jgi:hypothetical protein
LEILAARAKNALGSVFSNNFALAPKRLATPDLVD